MLRATVLGLPAADNALLVTADSGQRQTRALVDCGAGVLDGLSLAEVGGIDHLLFSHFHMDHVCGFDAFFRVNFDRTDRENHVWGPPGSIEVLGHRFRGFLWNLRDDLRGVWHVHELGTDRVRSARFDACEGFEVIRSTGERPLETGLFLETPELSVRALQLSHHGTSLGYLFREPERLTVDKTALQRLGLKGGPWLAQLKAGETGVLDVGGVPMDATELRRELLSPAAPDSLAYLSDFLLDDTEQARLAPLLTGVGTLFAEAQYAPADTERAARNHHTTVLQVAALAQKAGAGNLTLLHLSRRYGQEDWAAWLQKAQAVFPNTGYPAHWFGAHWSG